MRIGKYSNSAHKCTITRNDRRFSMSKQRVCVCLYVFYCIILWLGLMVDPNDSNQFVCLCICDCVSFPKMFHFPFFLFNLSCFWIASNWRIRRVNKSTNITDNTNEYTKYWYHIGSNTVVMVMLCCRFHRCCLPKCQKFLDDDECAFVRVAMVFLLGMRETNEKNP